MRGFQKKEKDFLHSGRRDTVEIMSAIIALTEEASTLTSIMEKVNLSYKQTEKYIELMTNKGLIKKIENDEITLYEQTEKGCKFFRIYCEMLRILYGEDFLNNKNNLAVACLSTCQRPT